jgi:uncharacterized protein
MRDKLRRCYQVQKEVTRNGCFEGEIFLSRTGRLADLIHGGESGQANTRVAVNFEFLRNETGIPVIAGSLETSLELECQRCLKPMEWPLQLEFKLMIDASDDITGSSDDDTVFSKDGVIDIVELVEDELILAIPLVATHEDRSCNKNWALTENEFEAPARENPFSVLKQLKTTD